MKNTTKVLAVIMAALMPALSCAVVLAGDDEREEPTRPLQTITGTYAGRAWSLSAIGSSSTLIRSTGTYAVDEYMKLKFRPTFAYLNTYHDEIYFTGSASALDYGNYFTDSLTKSYTVSQAASHYYNKDLQLWYDEIFPASTVFTKCKYTLKLDSNPVGSFTVNFE